MGEIWRRLFGVRERARPKPGLKPVGAPIFDPEKFDFDRLNIPDLPAVNPPNMPWGFLYRRYTNMRGLRSKHTRDLALVFYVATGLLVLFIVSVIVNLLVGAGNGDEGARPLMNLRSPIQLLAFSIPVLTVYSTSLFGIYTAGKRRFALVDVLSSEIIHILRTIIASRVFENTDKALEKLKTVEGMEFIAQHFNLPPNSEENYFAIFHRNTEHIGSLHSTIVDYITEFYTLYKSARDEINHIYAAAEACRACIRRGGEKEQLSEFRNQLEERLINRLYIGDNNMIAAFNVVSKLLGNVNHRIYAKQLALYLGIQANTLLVTHILNSPKREKFRYKLVQTLERRFYYTRLIDDLKKDRADLKADAYKRLEKGAARRHALG